MSDNAQLIFSGLKTYFCAYVCAFMSVCYVGGSEEGGVLPFPLVEVMSSSLFLPLRYSPAQLAIELPGSPLVSASRLYVSLAK